MLPGFAESFIVCKRYRPPLDFHPAQLTAQISSPEGNESCSDKSLDRSRLAAHTRDILTPYIVCGDLSGFNERTD